MTTSIASLLSTLRVEIGDDGAVQEYSDTQLTNLVKLAVPALQTVYPYGYAVTGDAISPTLDAAHSRLVCLQTHITLLQRALSTSARHNYAASDIAGKVDKGMQTENIRTALREKTAELARAITNPDVKSVATKLQFSTGRTGVAEGAWPNG